MIKIEITIGEIAETNKVRGMLLCTSNRDNPTPEEFMLERKVFDHIKLIGMELSELRHGTKVSLIEGEGGKKKGGRDGDGIPDVHRRG
jgi:hypothetical protein